MLYLDLYVVAYEYIIFTDYNETLCFNLLDTNLGKHIGD